MILALKSTFSSAHFYNQPAWDQTTNENTFGRCYTPYGHGHNYTLEVGFKLHLEDLSRKNEYLTTLTQLTTRLDHEHLNFVIPEFKNTVPTTENIALYFLDKLKAYYTESEISYIRLYEMDNLWTEIHL
ncbi:MAG: 6-carboxytetrahydropterin synthase [Bdellovibrio sp.]|nr:6-carboxytetrahydropterin synthase [Bdellovibrio sp.]